MTAALVLPLGVLGGIAIARTSTAADVKTFTGGALVGTRVATDPVGFEVGGDDVWQDIGGASLSTTVPAGKHRLVKAFFTAEIYAETLNADIKRCAVRVVTRKPGGSDIELYPRVGTDFALDTDDIDSAGLDAHAMKRVIRLPAGIWTTRVQARNVGIGGFCFFDDWYFEIESFTS